MYSCVVFVEEGNISASRMFTVRKLRPESELEVAKLQLEQ